MSRNDRMSIASLPRSTSNTTSASKDLILGLTQPNFIMHLHLHLELGAGRVPNKIMPLVDSDLNVK